MSTHNIGPNTPLRLAEAAALAFPNGGMTAAGLRREHARGRLVIEKICNKDYCTLAAIDDMRELCRDQKKVPASGSVPRRQARMEKFFAERRGSSVTALVTSPQAALQMKLQKRKSASRPT